MNNMRATQTDIAARQQVFGRLRVYGTVVLVLVAVFWGTFRFESWDLTQASANLVNDPIRTILAVIFNGAPLRYSIAPIAAIIFVFIWAGFYVKDVFALPMLRLGIQYVRSSVSGSDYPGLVIDGGEKKIPKGQINLLDAVGGPGYVFIHPGNAVLFRSLRKPTNITIRETYFLEPFETIGQIASLDEQQGSRDGVKALSRDGIMVTVKDIHYRFRLFTEQESGRPKRRTLQDPYPFDQRALWNMAYNLSVEEHGLESWKTAVGRAIVGGITEFINAHDIDYLTAPREANQDPRRELRHNLFNGPAKYSLRNLGAELIYVDLGHFAIDEETVDQQRTETWAAEWQGNAQVVKAYGDAKRSVYMELGRAEAQAELLMGISGALENIELGDNPQETVRRLVLARTAQLMEAMAESSKNGLEAGKDD
ncbi:MAG TPA: hypothetical protein PJ988_04820 [Anaerolinea sp.]|nr:hypothetical protein [Anaerolinea sp.]